MVSPPEEALLKERAQLCSQSQGQRICQSQRCPPEIGCKKGVWEESRAKSGKTP